MVGKSQPQECQAADPIAIGSQEAERDDLLSSFIESETLDSSVPSHTLKVSLSSSVKPV